MNRRTDPMTATMTNGKAPRKQLADQIDRLDAVVSERLDRLDSIIDTLADALPQAVADACKEGARQAVKDALIEIVTNPELRSLLAPARPDPVPTAPRPEPEPRPEPKPEPRKPGVWTRFKQKVAAARTAAAATAGRAADALTGGLRSAARTVAAIGTAAGEPFPVKRVVVRATIAGAAVGVACLVMPQTAAAAVGAVASAATAVAVQAGGWLKRAARRFGLLG